MDALISPSRPQVVCIRHPLLASRLLGTSFLEQDPLLSQREARGWSRGHVASGETLGTHHSLLAQFHRRELRPQEWRELAQGHFVVQGRAWNEAAHPAIQHVQTALCGPDPFPNLALRRPPPPVASARLCSRNLGSASSVPAALGKDAGQR